MNRWLGVNQPRDQVFYSRIFFRLWLAHLTDRPFRKFSSNSRIFCPQACPVTHICKLSRSVTLPPTHTHCPRHSSPLSTSPTSLSPLPLHIPLLPARNHSRTKVRGRVFLLLSSFSLTPPLFSSAFIVAASVSRPPVSFSTPSSTTSHQPAFIQSTRRVNKGANDDRAGE